MKRILSVIPVCMLLLAVGTSWFFSRPIMEGRLEQSRFDALALAPLQQAFTLARSSRSGNVVLVTALNTNGVKGINLSGLVEPPPKDAIAAFTALGAVRLTQLSAGEANTQLSWEELGLPVSTGGIHIAAGTNYLAHAEEVGIEEGPFLFPKLSAPTAWNSPVAAGTRLDFEVELCAVSLTDYPATAAGITTTKLAYLLCGDYTDRWQLVREIDLDGPMGVSGFPVAKGGPTRFPVGSLLVIPRQNDFYKQIELSLYLNDELRQHTGAEKMIWSPSTVLANALAECETDYLLMTGTMHLNDCQSIPAGTLLLTGTPGGVLFHLVTIWNPWVYLRPGDVVTSFGTYLGYMSNEIQAP